MGIRSRSYSCTNLHSIAGSVRLAPGIVASVSRDSARVLSRSVRWFIMILAITMALYHLGIAEKVIISAFSIVFGGLVLALAIAFGWGGRELAKDFLEKRYKRKEEQKEGEDHISHI